LVHQPHENYGIGGSFTLVDGMKGNPSKFGRDWLGFWGKDMNATIDLGKVEMISKISINYMFYQKEVGFIIQKASEF
jgi:hexosaminidase